LFVARGATPGTGIKIKLPIRSEYGKKKSQPEKNQEPAFHPLFVNPKKVEFENVFVSRFTLHPIDGKLSRCLCFWLLLIFYHKNRKKYVIINVVTIFFTSF